MGFIKKIAGVVVKLVFGKKGSRTQGGIVASGVLLALQTLLETGVSSWADLIPVAQIMVAALAAAFGVEKVQTIAEARAGIKKDG